MNAAFAATARNALILFGFALAFTALMAITWGATRDTIRASAEAEKMKLIDEVLPPRAYDNALLSDWTGIGPEPALGLDAPSRVLRARRGGEPVALLLEAQANDGYGGPIRLLVAVGADGSVLGVRVTQHRETPGLGDYIDLHKDRNKAHPWIRRFEGRGLAQIPPERWRVKKDGGDFDYVAGATISARAVTGAVGRALAFASAHRDALFSAPGGARPAGGG
ncbi:MAG: electron transport complex subunit RsxG [Rhodocyclales bacterium CG_4_9_14_3_um_filter_68_10]|nr:MAG: electron transport complex subunit RsxG [Rhodocyclales bacterium CG_4_9_14_3_um_filter_68_10]